MIVPHYRNPATRHYVAVSRHYGANLVPDRPVYSTELNLEFSVWVPRYGILIQLLPYVMRTR
jgi:hypothetical protein